MNNNERIKALNEELEILLDGYDDKDFIELVLHKHVNDDLGLLAKIDFYDKLLNLGMALVELGADANIQSKKNGKTLLMIASQRLDEKAIKNLIELGADVNKKDSKNRSALEFALKNHISQSVCPLLENKGPEILSELINHGADKNFLDKISSSNIYFGLSNQIKSALHLDSLSYHKEEFLKNFEKILKLLGKDFVLEGRCFEQQIADLTTGNYHYSNKDLGVDFLMDILSILKDNGAKIDVDVYNKNIFNSVATMNKDYRNRIANFLLQNGVKPDKIQYDEWNILNNISDNLDTLKVCAENNLIPTDKFISKESKKEYLKGHSKEEKKLIEQIIDQANAEFEKKSNTNTRNL